MRYRLEQIWKDKTETATSGTLTEDINIKQPLSRLHLDCLCTTSTGADTGHPAKLFTGIELSDGSDIIASLTGRQAQALTYFNKNGDGFDGNIHKGSEKCWASVDIDFGRFLYDRDFALMPGNCDQLQLTVNYDATLVGTTTSHAFNCTGFVFDEQAPNPTSFFMQKEKYPWVPVVNDTKQISLPVDYPYRHIIIQGLSNTRNAASMYTTFNLSEDGGARTPFNEISRKTVSRMNLQRYGLGMERMKAYASTTNDAVYTMWTQNPVWHAIGQRDSDPISMNHEGAGTLTIRGFTAGDHAYEGYSIGAIPHGCLALPICDPNNPADWYDMARINNLRLSVTSAAAVGTSPIGRVILSQVRPNVTLKKGVR